MNITQILLSATAAILLAALGLSYISMRKDEEGDHRKQRAVELLQDNARYEASLRRLRTGQPLTTPIQPIEAPESISTSKLEELETANKLLREQVLRSEKKAKQAEDETLAMNERHAEKYDKAARRARIISQAMIMAQVKEVAQDQGIFLIVLDVKRPESVRINTELAIRRGTGIIGRVTVSNIEEGAVFADPLPGTFPGGAVDVKVGDELIIPPL
ncbi:hypothetical protein HW115_06620 [Verrucomicrobiaceae bacterium N1E253]|uniref:Uncharacterized protein n=1 Tax=Oceaniferula marina TaxID=2748318 RepID=A0A851GCX5_9BACT|nr:hypothetical protein [Oceaniferula marina]NWK55276.1 hypothetical protein [Oceaniferula marina]